MLDALTRAFSLIPTGAILSVPLNSGEVEQVVFGALPQAFRSYGPRSEAFYAAAWAVLKKEGSARKMEAWRLGLERLPDSDWLNLLAAQDLQESGHDKESLPYARKAFEIKPTAYGCLLMARGYAAQKDPDSMRKWIRRAMDIVRNEPEPAVALGCSELLRPIDLKESITLLKQAFQSSPDAALARWIAEREKDQGKLWDAVSWYEKAIQLDSRNREAYRGLLNALGTLGESGRGSAVQAQAQSLFPEENWIQ